MKHHLTNFQYFKKYKSEQDSDSRQSEKPSAPVITIKESLQQSKALDKKSTEYAKFNRSLCHAFLANSLPHRLFEDSFFQVRKLEIIKKFVIKRLF